MLHNSLFFIMYNSRFQGLGFLPAGWELAASALWAFVYRVVHRGERHTFTREAGGADGEDAPLLRL